MKCFVSVLALSLGVLPAMAAEPDGLSLPAGFHAEVVADGLGVMTRHMAFGGASRLYVSTERQTKDAPDAGIIALHLGADHKVDRVEHFSQVDNGTAIAFYKGELYASTPDTIYRFTMSSDALVPTSQPETVVRGVPGRAAIAFDAKGNLFVAVGSGGNLCVPPGTPRNTPVKGLQPCPLLETRAGVWRFSADKLNQNFAEGEHYATGIRDTNALTFAYGALYSVMYGRDGAEKTWPEIVSETDGPNISDEMFRVVKGTDMGWPYTYYDRARRMRLTQPEYGGDNKTAVTDSRYAAPVAAFPAHVAPMDIVFYQGRQFPAHYRGGAFIPFHGAGGNDPAGHDDGYNVMFVPFDAQGKAGVPEAFADGFAGPNREDRNGKRAAYRPVGVAVGPDGALYVSDSQKGRIWRITYSGG